MIPKVIILTKSIILKIYNDFIFDYNTLNSGVLLSKEMNLDITPLLLNYHKIKRVSDEFPQHIIDCFGSISKFMTYPRLTFKPEHMGATSYLDKFKYCDYLGILTYIGIFRYLCEPVHVHSRSTVEQSPGEQSSVVQSPMIQQSDFEL